LDLNESKINRVETEKEKLASKVQSQAKMYEKINEKANNNVFEELREREIRKLNVGNV
jgi:hypothetical protein